MNDLIRHLQNMTFEQGAIAVIACLAPFAGYLLTLLWKEAMDCKAWRATAEPKIAALMEHNGLQEGTLRMVDNCPTERCPYKGKLVTLSIAERTAKRP